MPIMLKSNKCVLTNKSPEDIAAIGECPLDPGGYFIIKGVEKVILMQEQLSKNRIIIETDRLGMIQASVTSSTQERKSKAYVANTKGNKLVLRHNSVTSDIPIVVALKAMGLQSDKEIVELVCGNDTSYYELLAPSIEEAIKLGLFTQYQCLEYIGSKVKVTMRTQKVGMKRDFSDDAKILLATNVLAHVPVPEIDGQLNFKGKAVYIATMMRRVIHAIKEGGITDDRDFVGNKRVESAGQLMSLLFEDLFKTWCSNIKRAVDMQLKKTNRTSQYDAVTAVTQTSRMLTDGLFRSMSSGNWNLKRFKMERAGVTQILNRLSYVSALGMITRITSQFEKTRKVSGPRSLQTSQWGMLCTSDTPEGEACGLVKNLALLAHVTTDAPEEPVRRLAFVLGVEDINLLSGLDLYLSESSYGVFLNGVLIGIHRNPDKFVRDFRALRRVGRVGPFVSIHTTPSQKSINISSDNGRICRPLIIVDKGVPRINDKDVYDVMLGARVFDDLVKEGKIEYLDVNEEVDANIAVYEEGINYAPKAENIDMNTTHLEIAPFTVLGAVAGLIPYPHHNQSPRNTYQCAMGKQAMGAIAYNQFNRMDSLLYFLVYPQQPMVKTKTIEIIGYDKVPAGQAATVAVMSYSGYDIEDALVMNRASLDRGFGRCQLTRKYSTMIKSYANRTYDRLADPPIDPQSKAVLPKFSGLEADGIAYVGQTLTTGMVYVNKQTPMETSPKVTDKDDVPAGDSASVAYKSTPLTFKYPAEASVDKVLLTTNEEDQTLVKVLIRQTRRPELGDKFSSRHGQKGVVGNIVSQEDMPFTDLGICPDIIMNPHGFPSRMTVGKMIELLAGKAGVLCGELQYGTVWFHMYGVLI
jgi:DNA-directed RNA polymerase III subunit RPC2